VAALGEAVGKEDARQQTALLILALLQRRCSDKTTHFCMNCLPMPHLLFLFQFPPVLTVAVAPEYLPSFPPEKQFSAYFLSWDIST